MPRVSIVVAGDVSHQTLETLVAELPRQARALEVLVVRPAGQRPASESVPLPLVRYVAAPAGAASAELRANGVRAAAGDILVFLDAGRPISSGYLRRLRASVQSVDVHVRDHARDDDTTAVPAGALPFLSVVVPVHDCAGPLYRCLDALAATRMSRARWQLVVVDDASEDESAIVASQYADVVVRLRGGAHGADYARNRGAEVASGALLAFVSADVCVGPDTLAAFARWFDDPRVGAVSGNYDYASEGRPLTEYSALYNQFIRSRAAGDVDAFFPGLGAVRRSALMMAGGFDEWRQDRPRVAALELGHRIRAVGYRALLDPGLRGRHLKHRSLAEVLRQTLHDHGVPYDAHQAPPAEAANAGLRWVRRRERQNPLLCWLAVSAFALAGWFPGHAVLWAVAALSALVVAALNVPFFAYVAARRRLRCLVWVAPLHFAGSMLVGLARFGDRIFRAVFGEPRPTPAIEAYVEVGVQTWPPVPIRRAPIVSHSMT